MPLIRRYVVTFQKNSLMPEDAVQNTFHFDDVDEAFDNEAIMDALVAFYNADNPGAGTAIADFMSTTVSRADTASTIERYDLPDVPGPIGAPVETLEWGLLPPTAGTTPLVEEIAAVLTYHTALEGVPESIPGGPSGPAGDTKPRARRRGRLYLGPLNNGTLSNAAGQLTPPLFSSTFRTAVAEAAEALMVASLAAGAPWCVFSRTDWVGRPVSGGWIDNAPDTQRRRGVAPTARTVFTDT